MRHEGSPRMGLFTSFDPVRFVADNILPSPSRPGALSPDGGSCELLSSITSPQSPRRPISSPSDTNTPARLGCSNSKSLRDNFDHQDGQTEQPTQPSKRIHQSIVHVQQSALIYGVSRSRTLVGSAFNAAFALVTLPSDTVQVGSSAGHPRHFFPVLNPRSRKSNQRRPSGFSFSSAF